MKLNVCQFNDSYFPVMDGVGMTAHNYAHWINKKHGRSTLIAPGVKGYSEQVDYDVFRFKSVLLPGMHPYRVGLPYIDLKFKKKLKKISFNILHAHCPFITGHLASHMAKKLDIPLVGTFHSKYREDFLKILNSEPMADLLIRTVVEFYHKCDYVWVPNKSTGETLCSYGFRGEYEVMRNGSDMDIPDKFTQMKYRRKGLEMIGAGADDFILLFVGQHRWEKNVRMIIEALKKIKIKGGKGFKLVFAGEGYAFKAMKQMVRDLDLESEVTFMGVIRDRKKLGFLYASADLFVFPSLYDNSPLVVQEAAAFDLPSVVVTGSSTSEGFLDGTNGFLVKNDAAALANKILELQSAPRLLKIAGKGARSTLYHSWEEVVDDVYSLYEEIVRDDWRTVRKKKKLTQTAPVQVPY